MVDGVMVGAGTLLADDPELTVRHVRGRNPQAIIVDSGLRIPLSARLLQQGNPPPLLATLATAAARIAPLEARGAEVLVCKERHGRVDLVDLLARLGARGMQSILLEGGETLAGEMHRQGLIDKYLLFYAPCLLGGEGKSLFGGPGKELMADAARLAITKVTRLGGDVLVEAYPEQTCLPA
jgi:diaminohydroxyphosphoribosylaminopyrimidine deaminase/5-amino-6-(5-phosphoribosylamino)uracil reductase